MLTRLGLEYEIVAADVDETVEGSPEECVKTLARRKAAAGAENVPGGWVLAADTLVFLDDKALGKPKDAQDARRMLRQLSGKTHTVLTGMCLKNAGTGEEIVRCDGAKITFDDMTEEEIEAYVSSGEPLDKAGAYGIQGLGGAYIAAICGDYYATVGLSICGLRKALQQIEKMK